MKDVQAVIFDMDGLIFDTERLYFESNRQVLAQMGISFTMEDYIQLVGRSGQSFQKRMMTYLSNEDDFRLFLDWADQLFIQKVKDGQAQVKAGLFELLDYLDAIGAKKAIATSSKRGVMDVLLGQAEIHNRFDVLISAESVNHPKPHPQAFLKACQSLQADQTRTWVLEDSVVGLQAAHAAGIKAIMVPDLIPPTKEADQWAHAILSSLEEVKTYFLSG